MAQDAPGKMAKTSVAGARVKFLGGVQLPHDRGAAVPARPVRGRRGRCEPPSLAGGTQATEDRPGRGPGARALTCRLPTDCCKGLR